MPDCTPTDFWSGVLVYVLPPGGALLSATALWVGSRARSTSKAALSTSLETARRLPMVSLSPDVIAQLRGAQDRRKS